MVVLVRVRMGGVRVEAVIISAIVVGHHTICDLIAAQRMARRGGRLRAVGTCARGWSQTVLI